MDVEKLATESVELTKEIMDLLNDTVIGFAMIHAHRRVNPDVIGAAFISGLVLLAADLVATGPYSDAAKERIFNAAVKNMEKRFPLSLAEVNEMKGKQSEFPKVIIERNFNRNSEN
jgi:uncharacterized protein YlxP (DUF503 family)